MDKKPTKKGIKYYDNMKTGKLWKPFSELIRRRFADENGMVACCSCGKIYHWKELQCGHYIPRAIKNLKYHLKNNHAQCSYCNKWLEGNTFGYEEFIIKTYGEDMNNFLKEEKRKYHAGDYELMKIDWYIEKTKEIKQKLKELTYSSVSNISIDDLPSF